MVVLQKFPLWRPTKSAYCTQGEKSDLQHICNPVPRCKCREGNKFAIVQICVQIWSFVFSVFSNLHTNLHYSKFAAFAAFASWHWVANILQIWFFILWYVWFKPKKYVQIQKVYLDSIWGIWIELDFIVFYSDRIRSDQGRVSSVSRPSWKVVNVRLYSQLMQTRRTKEWDCIMWWMWQTITDIPTIIGKTFPAVWVFCYACAPYPDCNVVLNQFVLNMLLTSTWYCTPTLVRGKGDIYSYL